jgi:hypothetical protein
VQRASTFGRSVIGYEDSLEHFSIQFLRGLDRRTLKGVRAQCAPA